jgi:hypothetical protein
MSKKVIYTSVFGNYDNINKPNLSEKWDWKVFNEQNSLTLYSDNNRNAKRFKVLPHRYLKDYEYSIYVDGNFILTGDADELIEKYLSDADIAFFDHNQTGLDARDCVYEEVQAMNYFGNRNTSECSKPEKTPFDCDGRCRTWDLYHHYKDNMKVIEKQINKYYNEGYPKNNGLICGGVILRRHNHPNVIDTMEDWWTEIKYNSKRDQLSFNYVAWKNNLKFNYIQGDIRKNKYFTNTGAHVGKVKKIQELQNKI